MPIIVGTAGHIDHGKTSLVQALTGVDADRLPEEKKRGITIELGFARLDVEGRSLGVIDVPGHERFVRAMVAGATGIDLVVLVIAADEGVMPQTREHLDICGLLGIPRGLVVLSKTDLVEPDLLALCRDEVRTTVRGTFLEKAAIIPCSVRTGEGLPEVRAEIARLAAEASGRSSDGPFRLPLDRVFTMKGFGTVVTGTLASGRLREGESVLAVPGGGTGKVRGLEVHGEARSESLAGERTAANLQGATRDAIARGEVLVRPGEIEGASIVDVEARVLPIVPAAVKTRAKMLFHALTGQAGATVVTLDGDRAEPGGRSLAQIHLESPMALLPGDRFILRGFRTLPGYGTTVGGGQVLRVRGSKKRRADPAAVDFLRRVLGATPNQRIALEVEAAGIDGIDRAALRARLGESGKRIDKTVDGLLSRREAVTFHRDSGAVVWVRALEGAATRVTSEVEAFHETSPLVPGIDREELRTRTGRGVDARVFAVVLAELGKSGVIEIERDLIRRKGFSPRKAEAEIDAVTARAAAIYRGAGLAPPWSNELAAKLAVGGPDAAAALEVLVRRGALVRVKADLCFDQSALDVLRERLTAHLRQAGQITPQEWKELTGQSRKYSIPLAEHFDTEKLTMRVGEVRKLRGR